MPQKRPARSLKDAGRVLAIWYPSIILGYPFVVLLLGHSLIEGWQFLQANRGFLLALLIFPVAFIVFCWLLDSLLGYIPVDGEPPAAA